jgi:CRISPR-associated protein Cas2
MSLHDDARWIVTYDIADKKRLGRVHRALKKQGVPLQYSVFLVPGSAAKIASVMGLLAQLINRRDDDVRAYRVPLNPECHTLGAAYLPNDVLFGTDANLPARRRTTETHGA